jgi:hypothetical protein
VTRRDSGILLPSGGINAAVAMSGVLDRRVIRDPRPHKARSVRIPGLGRLILTRDPGESSHLASQYCSVLTASGLLQADGPLEEFLRDYVRPRIARPRVGGPLKALKTAPKPLQTGF